MSYITAPIVKITQKNGVPWATLENGITYAVPALTGYTQGSADKPMQFQVEGGSDNGVLVGFMLVNGTVVPFDTIGGKINILNPPGAVMGTEGSLAVNGQTAATPLPELMAGAYSVNNAGQVVGDYTDANNHLHGFLFENGQYYQLDPGLDPTLAVIDNEGNISGELYSYAPDIMQTFTITPAEYSGLLRPMPVDYFVVTNVTRNQSSHAAGERYHGPVTGLDNQYIQITKDNLNITATAPNSFIHSGSGEDAIDVSQAGGNNVLDGGTGSNFLVGGKGNDTFFLDDRAASADIWSTVVGFHHGDDATIWGITQADFKLTWMNDMGADGYKGLTGDFASAGHPDAKITLAGYSTADLSNGRLSLSYGSVEGNNYLLVHGA